MNVFKKMSNQELDRIENEYRTVFDEKVRHMIVDDELLWLDEELHRIKEEKERRSRKENGK